MQICDLFFFRFQIRSRTISKSLRRRFCLALSRTCHEHTFKSCLSNECCSSHTDLTFYLQPQPKQVTTLRNFLIIARRKDAKLIKIKKEKNKKTKFKVRTSRYLYTLVVDDEEKANKLVLSLPPGTFSFFFFVSLETSASERSDDVIFR